MTVPTCVWWHRVWCPGEANTSDRCVTCVQMYVKHALWSVKRLAAQWNNASNVLRLVVCVRKSVAVWYANSFFFVFMPLHYALLFVFVISLAPKLSTLDRCSEVCLLFISAILIIYGIKRIQQCIHFQNIEAARFFITQQPLQKIYGLSIKSSSQQYVEKMCTLFCPSINR